MERIIIEKTLDGLGTVAYADYLAHAYCTAGSCRFVFNGKPFILQAGNLMIVRRGMLVEQIISSADFQVQVIYVTADFISLSTPQSNYGTRGCLSLFLNPIMHLTPEQQALCAHDFEQVAFRLRERGHHFYQNMLIATIQMLILDFFDFHSHLYPEETVSDANASIMGRFILMLEEGQFRQHREVAYYADCLCVTPKYLSEVSKKVSGYGANYWIHRYTILDISRLLRDHSLSFTEIAHRTGFSSPAYFSRYVQQHLGVNPSDYRGG